MQDSVSVGRPQDTDRCANGGCKHLFGSHFTTYDGRMFGCSIPEINTRGRNWVCPCTGFMVILKWQPAPVVQALAVGPMPALTTPGGGVDSDAPTD